MCSYTTELSDENGERSFPSINRAFYSQKHSKDALMPDLDSGVWTSMQTIIFMQVAIIIFKNGIPLKMGLFALRWNSDLPVPVNTNEQITWPVLFLPTGVGWSVLTAENRKCMKTSKFTHTTKRVIHPWYFLYHKHNRLALTVQDRQDFRRMLYFPYRPTLAFFRSYLAM